MKRAWCGCLSCRSPAAFGRLCVETEGQNGGGHPRYQPPSGGCVLKLQPCFLCRGRLAAAFGRLCVETTTGTATPCSCWQPPSGGCVLKPRDKPWLHPDFGQPPSGGCVLKRPAIPRQTARPYQPPSGGCVLKHVPAAKGGLNGLPAAFGRLCVET